jgi:hypothetical protein
MVSGAVRGEVKRCEETVSEGEVVKCRTGVGDETVICGKNKEMR